MKFLFFTIINLVLLSANLFAVPTDGVQRRVNQPDGTTLTIRQCGDEYVHFIMTLDGFMVIENEHGGFYYSKYKNNKLYCSEMLAHDPNIRKTQENNYLKERANSFYDAIIIDSIRNIHSHLLKNANIRRSGSTTRAIGVPTTYVGQKRGLVILVEFPNLKMSSQTPVADYNQMFNSLGYSENNHVGSVHDYFYDQSYGKFDLSFDIIGPVTVSKNFGYYGSDSMNGYNDMNVNEMIVEACNLADEYVDYHDYDWDNDGEVDQVFIIYAGYGQATGGASNTIWPHESRLANCPILDNLKISQYACSNELFGSEGMKKTLMGIGTACHEFSHCLGLPDLYDTDYSGAYGMSYWSVMNGGSYNGPKGIGEVPCGYTAFERWFAGWIEFEDITHSQHIEEIPSLDVNPIAYRIYNDGNSNEFFTLENRQSNKWFKYVSQYEGIHGLLVTHIDYDFKAWTTNRVNPSPAHQRMSPIVADNSYGLSYNNLAGDLFPGYANVTSLTNITHVSYGGTLFNTNTDGSYYMNKSILNIKEQDGIISFDIIFNNEMPTPVATGPSDVTQTSFTANWSPVENVDSYEIELEIVRSTKPFNSEKTIIDNIHGTNYSVHNIDAVYCNYRVRAKKANLHTEWSNTIEVQLNDINDIHAILLDSNTSDFYTIDGIRYDKPQKGGLYIRNKRKIIFKK